jgi:peptidoglycan/LPS O-acetylase OafA/YrhL
MSIYRAPDHREWRGVPVAPWTRLGRWAVGLALVSGVGWLIALPAIVAAPDEGVWWPWGVLLVVGLVPGLTCAIAASIVAFVAMVRRGERAFAAYLGYVPVTCIVLTAVLHSLFVGD